MKKLDLIIPYFLGTRALFHNYIGEQNNDNVLKNSICNEQNIICAKVSLLSIILLGIKEDIVSNEGNLNYESKLIFDLLENNVEMIATNINGAYYIDGHKFDSAALAVVYIRNSMAHSKYLIDYENNNVILTNEGMNIRLNIDELSLFLINTFSMYKRNSKTNNYSIDYCNINKVETNRTIPIKRVCDLKSVIRNVEYFNFNIKSENGNVPTVCMGGLNCYVDLLKDKADKNILKKNLSDLNVVCNLYNCKLEINKEKIKDYEVENITENLEQMILNDNLPYIEQIKIIGREVQKSKNNMLNSFIPIFSNIKYLFILDGIRKTKSSDNKVIGDYLASHIGDTLSVSYDEVSALLINMFNTLFIYGLEDVYTNKLNYSLDRENEFDFSKLDLSNCNPTIDGIDYSPLYKARDTFNSVQKKYNELVNELNGKQEQLNNVKEKK